MVLAESGRGKSVLIDNWALMVALEYKELRPNTWAYLFLFEQDSTERLQRIMQAHLRLTRKALLGKDVLVPQMNLIIVDTDDICSSSLEGVNAFISTSGEKKKPGIIFIDYPANMDSLIAGDHVQLKVAGRELERLALKWRSPVVFGHQAVCSEFFDYESGHLLDERNIAGAKALKNSCRLCLSINRSKEQANNSLATINVFKSTRAPTMNLQVEMDMSNFYIGDVCEKYEMDINGNTRRRNVSAYERPSRPLGNFPLKRRTST